MKAQRLLVSLTIINLALLLVTLAHEVRPAAAQQLAPMLRGRGLEIVDDQGRVRASIAVVPAQTTTGADARAETVLLRLITERGRPSVKIGASEELAGLSFNGPTGTTNTYVILQSKGHESTLELRNEDGKERIVKP
jgi:hypothetical protein